MPAAGFGDEGGGMLVGGRGGMALEGGGGPGGGLGPKGIPGTGIPGAPGGIGGPPGIPIAAPNIPCTNLLASNKQMPWQQEQLKLEHDIAKQFRHAFQKAGRAWRYQSVLVIVPQPFSPIRPDAYLD